MSTHKKILIGITTGIFITVLSILSYYTVSNYLFSNKIQIKVRDAARSSFSKALPNVKIKEVMIEPSEDYVNFVHDKLYKVEMVYEIENRFKKIIFNVGVYKKRFVVPGELELLDLDRKAKVIFRK